MSVSEDINCLSGGKCMNPSLWYPFSRRFFYGAGGELLPDGGL